MYTYIYICIYTCYIYTHIHGYIYTRVHTHAHTHTHTHTPAHTHTHTHTRTHTHALRTNKERQDRNDSIVTQDKPPQVHLVASGRIVHIYTKSKDRHHRNQSRSL